MTSVAQRLEKLGYDSSQYSMETTRPVYELSDKELERRLSYERGEMGPRVGLAALGGAALGGLTGLTMDPTRVAPALIGAGTGAAMAAGSSYVGNRLKRMETERESARRSPTRKTASLGDITGFNESREGWRELTRTGGPERVSGLPVNVSAEELEERLKDSYAIKKLSNPAMSATVAGLMGGALGAAQYRRPAGALLALPSAAGAALGSAAADYLVADKVTIPMLQKMIEEKRALEKKASLAEYSNLFDAVEQGKFGPHVKEALVGVCEGMSYSLQSSHATKVAAAPTEADARQARINQLLRKM